MKLDVDDGVDVIDLRENESPDGGQDVILSPKKGILCQAQQNLNHLFKPMITTGMLKLELIQKKALERKLATDKDTADKAKRAEEKAKAEKDAVQALAKAKKEAEVAAKKELKMIADKCRLKKQEEKDAMEMQVMKNYFPKKEAKTIVRNASEGIGNVFAFELKKGMSMAPVLRRNKLSGDEYDTFLKSQSATVFLGDCKQSKYKMRSRGKPDKLKCFSFYGDKRPPYYGTFRKTSTKLCGRRPFAIENTLNYDEEWEEGEGDECRSDEETDAESLIGEEDDGGIVAHGYFSDDEIEGSIGNKQSRASVAAKEWQRAHDEKVAKSKVKLMIPMLYGIKYLTEEELCGDLPETLFRGMKLFPYH
uniref:Chromatin assembly factor 1 subunit A n=1 Tax=Rhabditophanes sp. KR3021 TaxID=114890 RepID=A0AC35U020_9BILA